MRRTSDVLDLAILGRLTDGPLHGYELRKRIMSSLGVFRTVSFGSLYPRLRALAERGLVAASDVSPDAALPHPLAGRRSRVVYELTPEGKEFLAGTLAAADPTAWDDESFDVRFSLFGTTEPSTRLRILEGRRARVLERREASRVASLRTRETRDGYTLELQRHGLELLDRELGWLDGLIATELHGGGATAQPSAQPSTQPITASRHDHVTTHATPSGTPTPFHP